ncbi:transcriptional regulator [Nonomuraea sp. NPDC050328]|uniref:transcriptional regulator n=1 Tax=Nonomuraea sp. NPDC050328 TaxID=3364361 RepID=UPI0037A99FDA
MTHPSNPPVRIDVAARTATLDDRPVTLSRTDLDVLICLAERPGCVLTRQEISREVWEPRGRTASPKLVDVYVGRIRRALGGIAIGSIYIQTEYDHGFRAKAGMVELVDDGGRHTCHGLEEMRARMEAAEAAVARMRTLLDSFPPSSTFVTNGTQQRWLAVLEGTSPDLGKRS